MGGCADVFNTNAGIPVETCEGKSPRCFKSKSTMSTVSMKTGFLDYQMVSRGCAEQGADCSTWSAAAGKTHECYCKGDKCNGAADVSAHVIVTATAAILSVAAYRLF